MDELVNFLKAQGFDFVPVCDGKIHRFKRGKGRDNAWFIGFQNHAMSDGSIYAVAQFGDWSTGEIHTFKPSSKSVTKTELDIVHANIKVQQEKVKAERLQGQLDVAEGSQRVWEFLKDHGTTEYTIRKKVTALKGTKRDDFRNLVVPMRDVEGKLWGVQRIAEDGTKKFTSGQKVKGTMFVFGDLEDDGDVFLCEGWATGSSIHMATQQSVICAFNASNLVDVAKSVNAKFPLLRITVCADNDESGVGQERAQRAAEVSQGTVVTPKETGDWNDVHCAEGIEAVKASLIEDSDECIGYLPLGFNGSTHFFYLRESRDVFSTATFSDVHFFNIAPRSHWAARFEGRQGIDWAGAKDHLITISRKMGPFDPGRVRGTGVWLDDGRTVVNSGYEMIVDGVATSISKFKSRYIYIQTANRFPYTQLPPLTLDECKPIKDFSDRVAFGREDIDSSLLVGWIAVARIAGALPIRPHLWITGGKGMGKSTIMEQFLYPLLGCQHGKLYLQGGSTEAGIRQTLGASSRPLIYDEAETTDHKSKETLSGVLDLNRQAWSNSRGMVVKGSAGGIAMEFRLSHCAVMSSIRVPKMNDADRSRYSILELQKPTMDAEEVAARLFDITEEVGERLFKRAVDMVPVIRENYRILFKEISIVRGNRVAQQNAMLLAGAGILESDGPITVDQARAVANDLKFTNMVDDGEPEDDASSCLTHLLTTKIRLVAPGDTVEKTVEEVILGNNIWEWGQLRNYGLIYNGGDTLAISDSHAELKKIYSTTQWTNWAHSLRRIHGSSRQAGTRFNQLRQRSTIIPLKI